MQSKNSYDKPALDYLFHPRSIAIVGVSTKTNKLNPAQIFIEPLLNCGYKGKIYLVGRGSEILGLKIYPSIKDVPGAIDYAISAIPAQNTPQLIADCATKGVKAVHMFTAGFSELGSEEGKQLESQIASIARQKGIRIIGPNCVGLYCPQTGLSFGSKFAKESGHVGFIVQSGGNSIYATQEIIAHGVYFSKVISHGNGCDLSESDFLEYLSQDPETKIIAAYIEGVKDGQRFIKVLRQAARVKPVVIYKGGTTETGRKVAASHTSAIAGSARTWRSLLRQAGAIQADSLEELIDVVLALNYMAPPRGNNIAVIGVGGGASVYAADACSNAGLTLPALPVEIRLKLKDIFGGEAGKMFNNPLDLAPRGRQRPIEKAIEVIANYDQIDLLLIHIGFDIFPVSMVNSFGIYIDSVIKLSKKINERSAVVLNFITQTESKQIASEAQVALSKAGFAVYPSISRAAKAISKLIQYYLAKNA